VCCSRRNRMCRYRIEREYNPKIALSPCRPKLPYWGGV
jgi:hypothetical protein